jgi:hypothetical protein
MIGSVKLLVTVLVVALVVALVKPVWPVVAALMAGSGAARAMLQVASSSVANKH